MSEPIEGPVTLRFSRRAESETHGHTMHAIECATMVEAVDTAFQMYTNHTAAPQAIEISSGYRVYNSRQLRDAWLVYHARSRSS